MIFTRGADRLCAGAFSGGAAGGEAAEDRGGVRDDKVVLPGGYPEYDELV